MKKYIFMLPLALMLFGCAKTETPNNTNESLSESVVSESEDSVLYTKGLELISAIDEIAESEEYREVFSASNEVDTVSSKMGNGDYSAPKAVYKISEIELTQNISDMSSLSENLQKNIQNKIYVALPTMLNASVGTNEIAASSIVTDSKYFICNKLSDSCLYLYVYDGDYSSMVSFIPHDENIVSAGGCFITNKALEDTSSAETIKDSLLKSGYIKSCKVEKTEH